MKIAVSGHRGLDETTTRLVDEAIRDRLRNVRDLVGISCLADGADQIFTRAVLDAGGDLIVIVPAVEYRDRLPASSHDAYDVLIGHASEVMQLDFAESTADAHMAASRAMLELAQELFAVWDGRPARSWGGTADVVAEARKAKIPVTVIWPNGARR